MDVLWHLPRLDFDDLHALGILVSELIREKELSRAWELQPYIGCRCDVAWPGHPEMANVLLTAVDPKTAIARVEGFPDVRPCEVPVHAVKPRLNASAADDPQTGSTLSIGPEHGSKSRPGDNQEPHRRCPGSAA